MAQSRLERIGTIFTRIESLMKGGAMKPENKPMWYIIYQAFPPKQEPRYDRAVPNIEIRDIFYEEDLIRAKFHNNNEKSLIFNLGKNDYQSPTLKFIEIHQNLQNSGVPEEQCYQKALEKLEEHYPKFQRNKMQISPNQPSQTSFPEDNTNKKSIIMNEIFKT